VNLVHLPAFRGRQLQMVVECPRGSACKLVYDPELEGFRFSRALPAGLVYPWDWGFVPGTLAPDGDPVDALLLWDGASAPGVVVACRPVALLRWEQDGPRRERIRNDRLVVVPADDARSDVLRAPRDLAPALRRQLERWFLDSVFFEDKHPRVLGWSGGEAALRLVRRHQFESGSG
jgi:inorganic pyrophosphatase